MKNHSILEPILKFKRAILKLDSSIECKIYENDLIFIIAINNDKYEQFKKDLNGISFKIHSQFTLDKEIVCMPQKFVSKWDIPFEISEIHSQFTLDKENFALKDLQFTYNDMIQQSIVIENFFNQIDCKYFNPNQNKERVDGCKAA